jgi:hypothetical protein
VLILLVSVNQVHAGVHVLFDDALNFAILTCEVLLDQYMSD